MSERAPAPTPLASIPATTIGSGMISPAMPFVAPDLTLAPINFRFLFTLWNTNSEQDRRIAAIEARLAAANIP
jgi:hypothetical protein